jgi:hypothetical protein
VANVAICFSAALASMREVPRSASLASMAALRVLKVAMISLETPLISNWEFLPASIS